MHDETNSTGPDAVAQVMRLRRRISSGNSPLTIPRHFQINALYHRNVHTPFSGRSPPYLGMYPLHTSYCAAQYEVLTNRQ